MIDREISIVGKSCGSMLERGKSKSGGIKQGGNNEF